MIAVPIGIVKWLSCADNAAASICGTERVVNDPQYDANRFVRYLFPAVVSITATAAEPQRIPLWDDVRAGHSRDQTGERTGDVCIPRRPAKGAAKASAIRRLPRRRLWAPGHGSRGPADCRVVQRARRYGAVLQYRNNSSGHQHPVPMLDGQRAIRTVRARAASGTSIRQKIGVMGFSAGGHLASTLATHFDAGQGRCSRRDRPRQLAARFLILCYPVISMTEAYMHGGSRENLLGKEPEPTLAGSLSNETQVTTRDAAHVHLPNRCRQGRARGKLRGVLPGVAAGRRAGRAAHLSGRQARRRPGRDVPRLRRVAQDRCCVVGCSESRERVRWCESGRALMPSRIAPVPSAHRARNKISRPGAPCTVGG